MRDLSFATPSMSLSTAEMPPFELPMVTVEFVLADPSHSVAVVVPAPEWEKLVSGFKHMPVDERQRFGSSIRSATASDPFPANGMPMDVARQEVCDTFISDCILLAALAEAAGARVLTETTVDSYRVVRGNAAKQGFN